MRGWDRHLERKSGIVKCKIVKWIKGPTLGKEDVYSSEANERAWAGWPACSLPWDSVFNLTQIV